MDVKVNAVNKNVPTHRVDHVFCKNKKCVCSAVAGFMFISVAVVSFVLDPVAIISKYCLKVDNGTRLYNKLNEKLDSITIKMYLFNITNHDRFVSGEDKKLKLQEVGPFTFRETRWNTDMVLDSENQTLSYTPFSNVTFVPEESIADPKDVIVHVPNIIFLSFASQLVNESLFIRTGFELLSLKQKSKAVLKLTAHEYFWGYDEPLIEMASQLLPGVVFYQRLGLLTYGYHPKRSVRLELDMRDENKFQVKTSNGFGGITRLGYQKNSTYCNTFKDAYEGFIFPQKLSAERKIRLYHNFFCRFLDLDFVGHRTLDDGNEALEYQISKMAYENTNNTKCLCPSGNCYRGLSDMSTCFDGLSMSMSHGHFLDADPRVYERLEGIKPDPQRHGSEFLIHKDIGLALKTKFSVQISIVMKDVNFCSAARPFSNMVLPYAWVQIDQQPLPEDLKTLLKLVGVNLPKIVMALEVAFGVLGTILILYTCRHIQTSMMTTPLGVDYRKTNLEREVMEKELEKLNFTNKCFEKQANR